MLQPVQREAVAPVDIALHPFPLAQSRPADGEHRRADLILFQQADIDIQPSSMCRLTRCPDFATHSVSAKSSTSIVKTAYFSLFISLLAVFGWQALPPGVSIVMHVRVEVNRQDHRPHEKQTNPAEIPPGSSEMCDLIVSARK